MISRLVLTTCLLLSLLSCRATATSLPPFNLPTLEGGSASAADLQGSLVMVFVLPHCPACETVLGWVEEAAQAHPEIGFVLVSKADSASLREMLAALDVTVPVILDGDDLLASVLGAYRAPTAYSFYDGRLLSRLDWAFGSDEISALADELATGTAVPWPVGVESLTEQLAPGFLSTDQRGNSLCLAGLPKPLLLAFVAAGCPYCQAMLPELLGIAAAFPVCLVVIGEEGAPPELREPLPGQLTVVLDRDGSIAAAYGIGSTPTIVVVASDGRVVWVHEGYAVGLSGTAKALGASSPGAGGTQ